MCWTGRAQHHPVAEQLRHLQRDPLAAAVEAPHLGAVAGVEVALEGARVGGVARGGDVEEGEEQRQIARLGAEDRPGRHRDQLVKGGVGAVVLDPAGQGLVVPVGGVGRGPGGIDGDLGRHLVELQDGGGDVGEKRRVRGHVPEYGLVGVRASLPLGVDVDVVAVLEGGELADLELLRQVEDVVLGRPDERGPRLGDLSVADLAVEGPPADPVAGLEHDHRVPRPLDLERGGQPGESGADHDNVGDPLGAGGAHSGDPAQHRPQAGCRPGPDQAAAADRLFGHPFPPCSLRAASRMTGIALACANRQPAHGGERAVRNAPG